MGRKRRSKIITGSEYNFGAGGAASTATSTTGMVRIVRGATSNKNADFNGYVSPGDTIKVLLDQNVAMPTKNRYVYFDSPYEGTSGVISYSLVEGALPSGMSVTNNDDDGDGDWGNFQVFNTPSATGSVKYKVTYNDAYESFDIFYELVVAPAGTTPSWPTTSLPKRIIRNTAGRQTLASAVTTSYATPTFSLKSVSGFTYGVTPAIDPATGEVYVENVGDIDASETPHSFIVSVDLGEYGVFEQLFSDNMGYGDPYGARYFGPANADRNFTSSANYTTEAESETVCTPLKSSGAVRRMTTNEQDTSPYLLDDGYGCFPTGAMTSYLSSSSQLDLTTSYLKNGVVGHFNSASQFWSSGVNHQVIRFRWAAPAGVTSFAAVAVGGGGPGMYSWSNYGGGGGGLAWMNGIACQPGEEFEICVGLGRQSESSNSSYGAGPSWIRRISTGACIIYAQGGGWNGHQNSGPAGQSTSYTGGVSITGISTWNGTGYGNNNNQDGGGWGVNTAEGSTVNGFHYGGGTAPYTSNYHGTGAGGYRENSTNRGSSDNGRGGGGGNGWYYSSTYGASAGGGVGLDGQGWGGTPGAAAYPDTSVQAGSGWGGNQNAWTSFSQGSPAYLGAGGGGSGGYRGVYRESNQSNGENSSQRGGNGGMHGGGGGGSGTSWGGGNGAPGGVRIIWGTGADGTTLRSFPYHYASERPDMKIAGKVDP